MQTSNEMDDEEIWYSKTSDDSEETCNSSETMIGDNEIKTIEVKDALEEEKKRLSSDAKIQNMLKSIVDAKSMPRLHAQSQNRLKKWKRYDTCPEKRYTLHYYWEKPFTRICKVIQPWIQPVTYAICLTKSCCQKTFNAFVFTRCLPCGWTRHRFVVVCYNIKPPHKFQWKVVTRWFHRHVTAITTSGPLFFSKLRTT
ncbi:hypothetical protein KUTeg_024603 [Tegillarca granosa]|uniref:Uncharacterized protein n=1 Tax=Tegillarca granosa TaxID=220873 RepID=A0ABQ9DYJ4_TEGGR|nr:hypothetical protein KUTeg_024603 [Tegillarca granosa]